MRKLLLLHVLLLAALGARAASWSDVPTVEAIPGIPASMNAGEMTMVVAMILERGRLPLASPACPTAVTLVSQPPLTSHTLLLFPQTRHCASTAALPCGRAGMRIW